MEGKSRSLGNIPRAGERFNIKWSLTIKYISIAGSPVLLNTPEAALNLLHKCSAKYSSRVPFVMANELVAQ